MGKKYVSEIISDDYLYWQGSKVFIQAPTGVGKSTFLILHLLRYFSKRGMKLLILCNRRLLRRQYWYQIVQRYERYSDLLAAVEVKTYQELTATIMNGTDVRILFKKYAGICLDEVHYFYSDSDFNGSGTYFLLQALIMGGMDRLMIFMTATADCIFPWIKKIIYLCEKNSVTPEQSTDYQQSCSQIKEYTVEAVGQYDYVDCYAVPDMETLVDCFANSEGKGIIFLDDKDGAAALQKLFEERRGVDAKDVLVINADNIEKSDTGEEINALVMTNKVLPKVIITTSVLDNGVSIHDSEVTNVAIITESKVSFEQMLGRIRAESSEKVSLYFLIRPAEFFAKRELDLKRILDTADELAPCLYQRRWDILGAIWNGENEIADIYRKVFVLGCEKYDVLQLRKQGAYLFYGDMKFVKNLFALEKIGDLYLIEAKFHIWAMEDPMKVIYEQMYWIGKNPDELRIVHSDYMDEQEALLKEMLLAINEFELKQLSNLKEKLAKTFGKTVLKEYDLRNRSFSTEKLENILKDRGLELVKQVKNDKNIYSVCAHIAEEV